MALRQPETACLTLAPRYFTNFRLRFLVGSLVALFSLAGVSGCVGASLGVSYLLDDRVLLCELYDLIDVAKGETRHGVCTAIVDGDTPCLCIM